MSTIPLEHDYIGLSESSSLERSSDKNSSSSSSDDGQKQKNILKETQLSLGLPGFGKDSLHILPLKSSFVSGAKRGFSDTNDGSDKWGFSLSKSEADFDTNDGSDKWGFSLSKSEADLGHASVLFSPKSGLESNNSQKSSLPPSTKPVENKKISGSAPAAKAQVVGWPPIRSFRKNTMATNLSKNSDGNTEGIDSGSGGCLYVKVSMDGAPFLRKVDLKTYTNYSEFSSALEKMFSCFTLGLCTSDHGLLGREGISESRIKDLLGSECVLTYEDNDGDWMLVGDVPWKMFTESCKRLRIMKAPRTMEKCKN